MTVCRVCGHPVGELPRTGGASNGWWFASWLLVAALGIRTLGRAARPMNERSSRLANGLGREVAALVEAPLPRLCPVSGGEVPGPLAAEPVIGRPASELDDVTVRVGDIRERLVRGVLTAFDDASAGANHHCDRVVES